MEYFELLEECILSEQKANKRQIAIENLKTIQQYFKTHTKEQNEIVKDFLNADENFRQINSEELFTGFVAGSLLFDGIAKNKDERINKFKNVYAFLRTEQALDPENFNNKIGSHRNLTYAALTDVFGVIEKHMRTLNSFPEYYKLSDNQIKTIDDMLTDLLGNKNNKNESNATSTGYTVAMAGAFILAGASYCIGGIAAFQLFIDDVLMASWSTLVGWATRFFRKLSESHKDKVANMTPAKGGYTVQNTKASRQKVLTLFDTLEKTYNNSRLMKSVLEYCDMNNPDDDYVVNEEKHNSASEEQKKAVDKIWDIYDRLSNLIYACGLTVASIIDITKAD